MAHVKKKTKIKHPQRATADVGPRTSLSATVFVGLKNAAIKYSKKELAHLVNPSGITEAALIEFFLSRGLEWK